MIGKTRGLYAVAACLASGLVAIDGNAAYPDRPVHLLVGQTAGGSTDATARLIAAALSSKWGQPVIVENKPGANGAIASDVVAHAPPDGYTLDLISATHTITVSQQKLNYDPVKSFSPVTLLISIPDVLVVNPAFLSVNSLAELVAYAKDRPGRLSYGSGGISSPATIAMALLAKLTGIKMVNVPFPGGGPALTALLGGEVQLSFSSVQGATPLIKAGKLKALAVSSDIRVPLLPEVPTVIEAVGLHEFNVDTWDGMLAPPGTPKEIVDKLHDDLVAVLKTQELQAQFFQLGYLVTTNTPEEFTEYLTKDIVKWRDLVKDLDVK